MRRKNKWIEYKGRKEKEYGRGTGHISVLIESKTSIICGKISSRKSWPLQKQKDKEENS